MPKDGQHNDDAHDYDKSKGPNNPDKSVTVTTDTPKKQETYARQAAERDDPVKQAQADRNIRRFGLIGDAKIEGAS